ncbi:hypothetical protein ACFL2C_01260 [Patescibacteria group bacterium]
MLTVANILKLIEKIENLMISVAVGDSRIQEENSIYMKQYGDLDDLLLENDLSNPNQFTDLWEFYEFWTSDLPRKSDREKYVIQLYKETKRKINMSTITTKRAMSQYIGKGRITDLKEIENDQYDLAKLVRICEEINSNYSAKNYISVGILVRTLLDHVPPLFGKNIFSEVVNNYKSGNKSFRESMLHLSNSSRKIADSCLHTPIRRREALPTSNQVDFSNDVDVLLGEVIRTLK